MANSDDMRALRTMRVALLVGIALNLGLIGAQLLLYPPLLAQPNSARYIAEPLVLLVAYVVIVYGATAASAGAASARRATLSLATVFGLVTGALWLVNLTLETFTKLSGLGLRASAPFLLGAFVLWGVAGLKRASQTRAFGSGLLAAVWSAMICVLLTITYGLLLPPFALARLSANLATDPDFLHSGWANLHAFVIANTFDAAFSHLLGALIVALVFGSVGGLLGLLFARLRGSKPQPVAAA
jgi:hypothetical protein